VAGGGSCEHARQFSQRIQLPPAVQSAAALPKVIKLLISRHPPAPISSVGDMFMVDFFHESLPAESRFSNHDEIGLLLFDCRNAFKQHRFPRIIELCGTSDALAALVLAHSEDDLSLHALCFRRSWNKVLARIKQLPTQAAVAELFPQDELGGTAYGHATANAAPVEGLGSMIVLGKLDAEKRNILDIADNNLCLPMHAAARSRRHQAPGPPPPTIPAR